MSQSESDKFASLITAGEARVFVPLGHSCELTIQESPALWHIPVDMKIPKSTTYVTTLTCSRPTSQGGQLFNWGTVQLTERLTASIENNQMLLTEGPQVGTLESSIDELPDGQVLYHREGETYVDSQITPCGSLAAGNGKYFTALTASGVIGIRDLDKCLDDIGNLKIFSTVGGETPEQIINRAYEYSLYPTSKQVQDIYAQAKREAVDPRSRRRRKTQHHAGPVWSLFIELMKEYTFKLSALLSNLSDAAQGNEVNYTVMQLACRSPCTDAQHLDENKAATYWHPAWRALRDRGVQERELASRREPANRREALLLALAELGDAVKLFDARRTPA